ncbi:hypothetical protein ABO04_04350 [Nitrosomonas sp. HPC101]|nr:hypothetical protein [Nitrosomonas sp. HPC101]
MNFKKMTDEELASTRDEVDAWFARYAKSIWSGRLGYAVGLLGVFGISTGVVFLMFDGFEPVDLIPILLGTVVCFMWYKVNQQHKNNSGFLGEVKEEIARRARKVEKAAKK